MLSLREKFLGKVKAEKESNLLEYQSYVATLHQLEKFEVERGAKLEDGADRQWFLDFYHNAGPRGFQAYAKLRVHMTAYLRFLIEQGLPMDGALSDLESIRFEDISAEATEVYLKNIATLRSCIDIAIQSKGAVDITVYDQPAAILYLSWYGFSKEQMMELEKTDVMETGVMMDGKLIEMEPFVMRVIHRYCESEGYYKESKGLTFRKYQDSAYLFRSPVNAQLSEKQLRLSVLRLAKDTGFKVLSIKTVYDSGIFFRMFVEESFNNVDFRKISNEELEKRLGIRITRNSRSTKLKEYHRYKEMF